DLVLAGVALRPQRRLRLPRLVARVARLPLVAHDLAPRLLQVMPGARRVGAGAPDAIQAVVAHEADPGEPQGGDDPHPAGRTPETVLGRGVAGETVAADATSDVAHDFPVLGPRLGPASRHPAGSSGRAARRT